MKKIIAMALVLVSVLTCFAACTPTAEDTKVKVTINVRDIPTEEDPEGVFFLKTSAGGMDIEPDTKLLDGLTALCESREGASYEVSPTTGAFLKFQFGNDTLEGGVEKIDEDVDANKSQFVITEFKVTVNGEELKDGDIKDYVLKANDVVEIRLTKGEAFWTTNE